MKTIVLSLIVLVAVTATASAAKIDPNDYSFPKGYEQLLGKNYPGTSISYILENSKEQKVKKASKETYISSVLIEGKPVIIDVTPGEGDVVIEFEDGTPWFLVSQNGKRVGVMLMPEVPQTVSPFPVYNSRGASTTTRVQKPKRERNGNGQGLAVAMGVLQQVAPRVLGGIRGWGGDIYSPQPSGVLTPDAGLRW
ncbi:MAG: hypothetical protein ACOYMZ_01390 [Minisyncoccia bacterium]